MTCRPCETTCAANGGTIGGMQTLTLSPAERSGTLCSTTLINADHPEVLRFAQQHAKGNTDRDRAVALFLATRDGFRYDPYRIDLRPTHMSASSVLQSGHGWWVTKAALLTAACRAVGIPSRVGYADVRNHLSTERLRKTMQTDLFIWHGYSDIWLDGRWVKATPAFNIELCTRFGLLPLEFDGTTDSIYHPFDQAGNRHMEYVHQRGAFDDVPLAQMVADFAATYPGMATDESRAAVAANNAQANFADDAARERA